MGSEEGGRERWGDWGSEEGGMTGWGLRREGRGDRGGGVTRWSKERG